MVADPEQGVTPACIDWAALSGIAGDHSCSSAEMLETVRKSDWILVVADVAAQLKVDLARIPVTAPADQVEPAARIIADAQRRLADEASRAKRLNAQRSADTRMQRADPQYATRADANLAHFLLPRPDTNLDPIDYGRLALKPGSDLERSRRLCLVSHQRDGEGEPARQRAAFARGAARAGARHAVRRGVRAALSGRRLCGRSRRGQLGRCVAAQGHARLLQPERARGVHVEGARTERSC